MSANSLALEVYRNSLNARADHWTFFYNEDSKWILESVSLDGAGWPALDQRKTFDNEVQARVAVTAAVAGHVRTRQLPLAGTVLRGPAGTSLWTVTNQWSWDWEVKYADWVKTELDRFWWKNHGLATDCADVAYSARWIFARNHGLPMANRLASGQWFTQDSVKPEWASLPTARDWDKDQRFLAGLNYMLNFVFTHTLWNDSYPIAISAASLLPGAHHLNLSTRSGHTQFVYRVGTQPDQVPVLTLNSTVPRDTRELFEYIFFNSDADPASSAFLRMRWPEIQNGVPALKDPGAMPYFSAEQFDSHFVRAPRTQFWEEVFYRLNPAADFNLIGQRTAEQVADLLKARISVVEDGYEICSQKHCAPGTSDWEAWSTPSRDDRIRATVSTFYNLNRYIQDWSRIDTVLQSAALTQGGYTFNVDQLMAAFNMQLPNSDPNEEPLVRWGVHPVAIGTRVLKDISRGLRDRESKILGAHGCADATCVFGSKAFLHASTYNIDAQIAGAGNLIGRYCQTFGQILCDEAGQILKSQTVTANGRTLNLWDWMSAAFRFNSDPRHTGERRFSGFSAEFPHLLFGDMVGATVRRYGQTVFDSYRFYDVQGANLMPWSLPTGERALDLDAQEGWVWTTSGNALFARQSALDPPVRFLLTSGAQAGFAHAAHFIVADAQRVVLLKIENGQIREISRWPSVGGLSRRENGFVQFASLADGIQVVDLEAGKLVATPADLTNIQDIRRAGADYFLKYSSANDPRMLCRLIREDSTFADLSPTGNCINYAPLDQTGLFEVNNRAVRRVFQGGLLVHEEDVGGLGEYYSDRLLKSVDHGQYRYFCFGAETLTELIKPSGVLDLATCNDRFVIEAVTLEDWRVRDRATGAVMARSMTYLDFASNSDHEHYAISSNYGLPEDSFSGLLDIERPERFSVLTSQQIWPNYEPRDRRSGLSVIKDRRAIWLAD